MRRWHYMPAWLMAKFPVGTEVYVPSRLLPNPDGQDFALTRTRVAAQNARSVRVNLQNANGNDIEVASRLLHGPNLGITVFRIGDLLTEDHTLDPLSKSTLHYLRLLLEPDAIRLREVRTTIEIQRVWERYESVTSHVVLIGHGNPDSIRLLDCNRPVSGNEFARFLQDAAPTTAPKTFVSLSCLTGRQPFAKPFSQSEVCADFLAPFQSVHSAAASLFAQSYFAHHLLNGAGVIAAFTHARRAVGSGVSFRHWRNGDLTPTPDL